MTLRIRLARGGAKKRPHYSIVIADSRKPRDGKFIEKVGFYNPLVPKDHEQRLSLNEDRIKHWMSKGAQPSDRVLRFLDGAGIAKRPARNNPEKAQPKAKTLERIEAKKQAEEDAKAAAEEATAEESAAEETPSDDASAEAAADEAPAEVTADEAPVEAEAEAEASADEKPAEDAPAEGSETEEPAAEDAAGEEEAKS